MPFSYISNTINPAWCLGNSLSTMNINFTALDTSLLALSTYTVSSINHLSSEIDGLQNVYVNLSGDIMTGSLSAPVLSAGTLYVAASSIYFTLNNTVIESLKSSDVTNFKNTFNSVNLLSGSWGSSGSSGASLSSNTFSGTQIIAANGSANNATLLINGGIFTGGSGTTTKPQFLIEPTGTTSTGWNTNGTLIGANAPTGFSGNLADFQINGTSKAYIDANGIYRSSLSNGIDLQVPYNTILHSDAGGVFAAIGGGAAVLSDKVFGWNPNSGGFGSNTVDAAIGRVAAGQLEITTGTAGTRGILFTKLPTSNPGPGVLWNNGGTPAIGT